MSDQPDLWEVRELPGGLTLELRAGDDPALVLAQGENRVRVELAAVKGVVAALVDAAADLAEVLASGAGGGAAGRVAHGAGTTTTGWRPGRLRLGRSRRGSVA